MSVITMRTHYFIHGIGLVPRVKSLNRHAGWECWRVTPTNDNDHYTEQFYDRDYGGAAGAYKAAMRKIRKISDIVKPKTKTILMERSDKRVPLGMPGLILVTRKSMRKVHYYFRVTNPLTGSYDEILIGDEVKVMDHWEIAISRARALRSSILYRKRMRAKLDRDDEQYVMSL